MDHILENYRCRPSEANIDFTGRNAIHDILDFDNQATVKKNRKHVITHIKDMMHESKISLEIV